MCFAINGAGLPAISLPGGFGPDSPLWEGRNDDKAYVCEGYACKLPTSDARQFSQQLDSLTIEP